MEYYAKTDRGMKRKMNQDYLFASGQALGPLPDLFLLADGMGGHKAGDFASRYLVEHLCQYLAEAKEGLTVPLLEQGIKAVNGQLLQLSMEREDLRGMGTTLVALVVEEGTATVANIGDSRAYHIHRNRIRQITRDHSFVEEMVERGYMRRGSQDYLASKNIITRAVGTEEFVEADFFEVDLEEGDFLLLCSDGLSNMVDNESILSIVKDASSVQQKVEALVDMANINGGRDNISVILISLSGEVAE